MTNPVDVVSAFLVNPQLELLLLKRSNQVRTYPECWGVVSGYVETCDPFLQAEIEIREETQLPSNSFSLTKKGIPVAVNDPEKEYKWRVHPYKFVLGAREDDIKLSNEHVDFAWINPESISEFRTVPELVIAWERVSDDT